MRASDIVELVRQYKKSTGRAPDSMWVPLEDDTVFVTGLFSFDGKDHILPRHEFPGYDRAERS
jgi:hypothetical protein